MVFMYLGTGIGVGFSFDGEPDGGSSGNAGELGRLLIMMGDPDRHDSFVGRGLDADPAILVRRAIDDGVLPPDTDADPDTLRGVIAAFATLTQLASAGNPKARDLITQAGQRIANVAGILVELADADFVVFGGPSWHRVRDFYWPAVESVMAEVQDKAAHPIVVAESVVGNVVGAVGAAAAVLDSRYVPRASVLSGHG
jgi:predicted NBD/HSP70 family sugar kinase